MQRRKKPKDNCQIYFVLHCRKSQYGCDIYPSFQKSPRSAWKRSWRFYWKLLSPAGFPSATKMGLTLQCSVRRSYLQSVVLQPLLREEGRGMQDVVRTNTYKHKQTHTHTNAHTDTNIHKHTNTNRRYTTGSVKHTSTDIMHKRPYTHRHTLTHIHAHTSIHKDTAHIHRHNYIQCGRCLKHWSAHQDQMIQKDKLRSK